MCGMSSEMNFLKIKEGKNPLFHGDFFSNAHLVADKEVGEGRKDGRKKGRSILCFKGLASASKPAI